MVTVTSPFNEANLNSCQQRKISFKPFEYFCHRMKKRTKKKKARENKNRQNKKDDNLDKKKEEEIPFKIQEGIE